MATQTEEQNLLEKVEALEGEIEELERRKGEAKAVIRRASRRFEELDEQRRRLSPKTFSGDSGARLELEVVEDEHEALNRSVRVANSAVPEFERMLGETKAKRRKAQEDVHRERYRILSEESGEILSERDELADRLQDLLERQSKLHSRMQQEMRQWDGEQANRMAVEGMGAHRRWFEDRFGQWLR